MAPSRASRLVTLSSDLGAAYAAQMKAVLARELPAGSVVELSHDLRAHDIGEAGFVVRAMADRFPAGSVHVVVVDPGVGGARSPVAVRCRDGSVLLGPNNGVLVPLADALGGEETYRIDRARLSAAPRVGTTFDGRDLFAPAAARVATGTEPRRLGPRTTLYRPQERLARRTGEGAVGSIVHVDHFGSLITDVPTSWVPRGSAFVGARLGRTRRRLRFVASYEEGGRGHLVALGSSFGTLELAVGEGRAADRVSAGVGAPVRFVWRTGRGLPARRKRK